MTGRSQQRGHVAAAMIAALLGEAALAEQPPRRAPAVFGVAVGYNRTHDPTLEDLRYADDDAARNYLLLRDIGAEAALLTRLDAPSRALYPGARPGPPTSSAIRAALARFGGQIDAARREGRRTVLYFFYSGHGDIDRGEGFVQLEGEKLKRSAFLELLRASRADVTHAIIDSCRSYFLVFARGPGGRRRKARGPFLPKGATLPKRAGFFLSTSAAQESHEWEAFQGGVFSHEMRSALRGAADIDENGVVTYEEAAAFVYNANRAVPNWRYRPSFFVRSPTGGAADREVLIDLREVAARRIIFGPKMDRHFFVEDEKGIRLADLYPGRRRVVVVVPPRGKLFVREATSPRREYSVSEERAVVLAQLTPGTTTSQARGAEHESFRRLFTRPFDRGALRAFQQRPAEFVFFDHGTRWTDWLRPTVLVLAISALANGGLFTGLAAREKAAVEEGTSNLARQQINDKIERYNTVAVTSYIVGAAAGIGFLVWRLWPRPRTRQALRVSLSMPGYHCCENVGICRPAATPCPSEIPPSTNEPCASDEQCSWDEGCHAWKLSSEGSPVVAGSEECRRKCDRGYTCGAQETCQLSLHDGALVSGLDAIPLCLPADQQAGCAGWSCDDCPPELLGKTFCKDNSLHGCLVSAHSSCGLICQAHQLAHCKVCEERPGETYCEEDPEVGLPMPVCEMFPCAACPPQRSYCEGSVLRSCLWMPYHGECTEICVPIDVASCASGCSEKEGGARCNP